MSVLSHSCGGIVLVTFLFLTACNILGGEYRSANNVVADKTQQEKAHAKSAKSNIPSLDHTKISAECIRLIENNPQIINQQGDNGQPVSTFVKVGATGYGAPPKNYFPAGQRRLMTIRASKVDAYRALTEVVGGLHVWGSTAIEDMVLEKDRYRTFIDTYVRGARIVSVVERKDGTYESMIEMSVDRRFLSQIMSFLDPMLAQCLKKNGGLSFAQNSKTYSSPSFYYSE
jgi:hypothetical protein